MTSTNIYTPIAPTYLYIKQHSITGLKYFGMTTKKDPYKYKGSGTYWKKHIKKHGKEHVITLWVSELYTDTSIIEHSLHFSYENNIVESAKWANLIPENGMPGVIAGIQRSDETKRKMSASTKGRIQSKEWSEKGAKSRTGLTRSIETKSKMSLSAINKPKSESHRLNLSIAVKGIPHKK